jgi:hypothetical protein
MLHKKFKSFETGFKHFETELLGGATPFAGTLHYEIHFQLDIKIEFQIKQKLLSDTFINLKFKCYEDYIAFYNCMHLPFVSGIFNNARRKRNAVGNSICQWQSSNGKSPQSFD